MSRRSRWLGSLDKFLLWSVVEFCGKPKRVFAAEILLLHIHRARGTTSPQRSPRRAHGITSAASCSQIEKLESSSALLEDLSPASSLRFRGRPSATFSPQGLGISMPAAGSIGAKAAAAAQRRRRGGRGHNIFGRITLFQWMMGLFAVFFYFSQYSWGTFLRPVSAKSPKTVPDGYPPTPSTHRLIVKILRKT